MLASGTCELVSRQRIVRSILKLQLYMGHRIAALHFSSHCDVRQLYTRLTLALYGNLVEHQQQVCQPGDRPNKTAKRLVLHSSQHKTHMILPKTIHSHDCDHSNACMVEYVLSKQSCCAHVAQELRHCLEGYLEQSFDVITLSRERCASFSSHHSLPFKPANRHVRR